MRPLRLTGFIAATHTPFKADGALHLAPVEKQAEHLSRNGIQTAFISGTTGEAASLTCEERRGLTTRWLEVTRGSKLKVIVHVGTNCLADARTLAAHAQAAGALAIAAYAPAYFKPRTLDCLIDCCADIACAAPELPFYFYDIPSMTGVVFPMSEFLERAAKKVPNLAGLKFTNLDLVQLQCVLRAGDGRFDVFWGVDECFLGALALGCRGAVGSTYNLTAPLSHRLVKAFDRGDLATARREQTRILDLVLTLNRHNYLPASRAALRWLGVDCGPVRLPLINLTRPQTAALRRDLEKLGFFDWVGRGS